MSPGLVVLIVLVGLLGLAGAIAGAVARRRPRAALPAQTPRGSAARILLPFTAGGLSRRALDASLRLARAEDATVVPVFLATVPYHLPLDSALPRQSGVAVDRLEAIEQHAAPFEVPVEGRIARGRSARHALREAMASERFDRIVIAAAAPGAHGFTPADIAWLLASAPGEILALRPGTNDVLLDDDDPGPGTARRTTQLPSAYV